MTGDERASGSPRRLLREIAPFAVGGRRAFTLLAISSIVGGGLEAVVLVLVTRLAVGLSSTGTTAELPLLGEWERSSVILLAIGLLGAKLLLQLVSSYQGAALATRSLTQARVGLLNDFLGASWPEQTRNPLGVLQELTTTHVDRVASILLVASQGLVAATNVLALLVAAVLVSPAAAGGITATGLVLAAIMRPLTTRIRRTAARQVSAGKVYAASVTEAVAMAREIRVLGAQRPVVDRITKLHRANAEPYQRSRFLVTFAPGLYQSLAIAAVLGALALVGDAGSKDVASIGAVVLLLLRALSFSQQAQASQHQVQQLAPYLSDLRDEQARYRAAAVRSDGDEVDHVRHLALDHVTFRYEEGRPALDDVSFEIEPGESIGIVGPSGSGKSTIVQLLLRLRIPQEGRLLADGRPAEELSLSSWYDHVAYVPQEPQLFAGTVAQNIDFHRGHVRAAVADAAAKAYIEDEILALPDGFDTRIGEGGAGLSGGQRQRICIARALLGEPDILVLDEPTSALDLRSEAGISKTLRALHGSVSLVIVAHRLSTLADCDRVLVVLDGRIQAFGQHQELMSSSPFYREAIKLAEVAT